MECIKVLVVDQDRRWVEVLERSLLQPEYDLFVAGSFSEATKVSEEHRCAIAVVGMGFGEGGPLHCAKVLLDRNVADSVVVATATNPPGWGLKAFKLGVADYICKTLNPSRALAEFEQVTDYLRRQGRLRWTGDGKGCSESHAMEVEDVSKSAIG